MSSRTFQVKSPHMTGDDITMWQRELNEVLNYWNAEDLVTVDGDYGIHTRTFTSRVLYGFGIAQEAMEGGVTPELRIKVRNRDLTVAEWKRFHERADWRLRLQAAQVASPLNHIIADSWGYHPGVHDGIDLICPPEEPIYAMVPGKIVRVSAGGWWGNAPSGDVTKGDGIIILRSSTDVGPFKKNMNVCYGHSEHAIVDEGQNVKAGQRLGRAGLAVAWHIHLMINDNPPVNGFYKGVGDRDPRPYYDYARKNG